MGLKQGQLRNKFMNSKTDKAGENYWEEVWKASNLQPAIIPESKSINNYFNHIAHNYFKEQLGNLATQDKKILEVGCGNSVWLPYFAKEFGMNITGLDYSEHGCAQERKILEREGITGEIICSDFFSPPENLIGSFDFVVSFGVIEHFTDTTGAIKQLSKFLKKGGLLITFVPNLTGLYGFLQKRFNRPVFDIHYPMDKEQLKSFTEKAGLQLINIQYAGVISLSLNLEGKEGSAIAFHRLKKTIVQILFNGYIFCSSEK
jgi:cyclopropane fatty-acyl-phospholipid synthase-like methyltransferase